MQTLVSQTFIVNPTPQVARYKHRVDEFLNFKCAPPSTNLTHAPTTRQLIRCLPTAAVLSDAELTSAQFQEFSVSVGGINDAKELKISVNVSGSKTQQIFDDVFGKMVAAAQPIPGFRRVKGGKTPNIPKEILLEVLGASRVYKEVIKKIINSSVAEYVEKERLMVSTNLRVEQSFEDLESRFEEGEEFSFDVVVELQK
ncbi:hypothetical protein PIB30_019852 [Stylosanthes scabra]|uniref:Trigger factor ribosome-binding bacterial domain-containing protein n=1 Tax=Stylosanthes scabra TaxID=79078 RepID=A0ABU6S8I8_9FABA|nr:hypothetical protein [Stylosanthes scabra]